MQLKKGRKFTRNNKLSKNFEWQNAPDIKRRIRKLASDLNLSWIKPSRIFCIRSANSKTRARARIWGLSRIWQQTLKIPPSYVIEVISEHFDKLGFREQDEILLHELTHIPRNFSGSLLPHIRRGRGSFYNKVEALIAQYIRNEKS